MILRQIKLILAKKFDYDLCYYTNFDSSASKVLTLAFLINGETRLFNICHPQSPCLFDSKKITTLDMNFCVVKIFFHPLL